MTSHKTRGFLWLILLWVLSPIIHAQESLVVMNTTVGNATLAAYPQPITNGSGYLSVGDMDGDLDIDVIGSDWWVENVNGDGMVWSYHSVDTQITFIDTYTSADFDLNGTIDLVAGSDFFDQGLALMLNTDGSGTNWARRVIELSIAGGGHLVPVDIDSDSDPDILGVFEGTVETGGLLWWENPSIGSGTNWSSHMIEEVFEDGSSILTGNLDGDSNPDVIVASANQNLIVAWLNTTGDGMNWDRHVLSSTVDAPSAMALGDVDGNGWNDLLVAASGEDTITLWFQLDGSGTNYLPFVIAEDIDNPSSLQAVDLDGDMDLDILAGTGGGLIAWFENLDGSGTVWTQRILSTDQKNTAVVLAADMNGDGQLNILQAGNSAAWWLNPYFEAIEFSGPSDTNLVTNAQNVYAYLTESTINTSSGRWVTTGWERTGSDPMTGSGTATGPFDISNDTTITFSRQEQFFVDVSTSGEGSFSGPSGWLDRGSNIVLEAIAEDTSQFDRWEGDLPGGQSVQASIQAVVDGPLSFIACFSPEYFFLTVSNLYGSTLIGIPGMPGAIESIANNQAIHSCAVGDFDNDGHTDVAGLGETDTLTAYLNQTGLGTSWQREQVAPSNPSQNSIAAGDLNRDGQDDLIVASDALDWWTRVPGTDTEWRSVDVSSNAAGIPNQVTCVLDVNGDGNLDLATAGGTSSSGFFIRWYDNLDGKGRTWAAHNIATNLYSIPGTGTTSTDGLIPGDIDGDGDTDLLLIPGSWNGIYSYWENLDGTGGSWSNHSICDIGYYYYGNTLPADLADVDYDGDLDLLVPNAGYRTMNIWINQEAESQEWAATNITLSMTSYDYYPISGLFLDLNNDEYLDVIAIYEYWYGYGDAQVWAFYNPGLKPVAWTNTLLETLDTSLYPRILTKANLDADGTLDVLGYGDGGISFWRRPMQIMTIMSPPSDSMILPAQHGLQAVPLPATAGNSQTQWVVSGWTQTGSVPLQGNGKDMPVFSFTNDTALTWTWSRQFKLDIATGEGGETDELSRWVNEGDNVDIHATAYPYYSFGEWQGDTNDAFIAGTMLSLTMDHAFALEALFLPDLTSQQVPYAWLAQYGWTNQFEEAALSDSDFDSAPAWKEYFADTDPTNEQSVLRISEVVYTGTTISVNFQGGREATQIIEFSEHLGSEPIWIPVLSNIPPTLVSNTVEITPPAQGTGILRIRAHR